MPPIFLETIIISVVLVLLTGEGIAILNICRLSNPIKSIFSEENSKEHALTHEERTYLLRDLEIQKKMVDRE